jgi:hypothetical protein
MPREGRLGRRALAVRGDDTDWVELSELLTDSFCPQFEEDRAHEEA